MLEKLTERQIVCFRLFVKEMIPPSTEYGLPGADDREIFDNILIAARGDLPLLEEGLSALEDFSQARHKKEFTLLDDQTRSRLVKKFLSSSAIYIDVIQQLILQCYYRDDRVMASLGMEARPPFPRGYQVDQSDWSLLEPVRRKDKIYRDV